MLFGLTDIVSIEIRGTVVAKAFIPLFRIILLRVSLLGMYLICTVDFIPFYFNIYLGMTCNLVSAVYRPIPGSFFSRDFLSFFSTFLKAFPFASKSH